MAAGQKMKSKVVIYQWKKNIKSGSRKVFKNTNGMKKSGCSILITHAEIAAEIPMSGSRLLHSCSFAPYYKSYKAIFSLPASVWIWYYGWLNIEFQIRILFLPKSSVKTFLHPDFAHISFANIKNKMAALAQMVSVSGDSTP